MENETKTRSNRGQRFPPEILSDKEVGRLLSGCSPKAPSGIRNRALITTLYRAGLRVSEALSLYPKDTDSSAGTIRVLSGKGSKARTVGMDPVAFSTVELWLAKRRELGVSTRRPLFCTLQGQPMHTAYVRALLKRLARKTGIEKRVHPHGLRHTCAAQMAAEGIPVNVIQAQLGHSSLATTSRYLDHIAPQQLISVMASREWQ